MSERVAEAMGVQALDAGLGASALEGLADPVGGELASLAEPEVGCVRRGVAVAARM
jgi:hypothetical protein